MPYCIFRFAPIDLSELQPFENVPQELQQLQPETVQNPKQELPVLSAAQHPAEIRKPEPDFQSMQVETKRQKFSNKKQSSVDSSSDSNTREKVPPLMAACHQGLEHSVSKILWRKVSIDL